MCSGTWVAQVSLDYHGKASPDALLPLVAP